MMAAQLHSRVIKKIARCITLETHFEDSNRNRLSSILQHRFISTNYIEPVHLYLGVPVHLQITTPGHHVITQPAVLSGIAEHSQWSIRTSVYIMIAWLNIVCKAVCFADDYRRYDDKQEVSCSNQAVAAWILWSSDDWCSRRKIVCIRWLVFCFSNSMSAPGTTARCWFCIRSIIKRI